MCTLGKFLKDRRLKLNAEKSKVLVFNRRGNERKERWKWGNKEIEKIQNFKYLGFTFNRKGNYKDYIKELVKKFAEK